MPNRVLSRISSVVVNVRSLFCGEKPPSFLVVEVYILLVVLISECFVNRLLEEKERKKGRAVR